MKFISTITNDIYFLKHVFQYSKSYVGGEAAVSVIQGLTPLIDIILPKMIIDTLIYGTDFYEILQYIMLYVLLQLLSSFAVDYINDKYIQLNGHLYAMHFLLLINKKMIDLDMVQLDDPKVHQKAALAEDLIYKGIGIDIIDNFFTAITSIISIIATAAIIVSANVSLIFVIILSSVLSIFLNLMMENWQLSQRDENVYLTRVLNYYIKIMGDKTCSKEMRLYGFAEWVMKKYKETLKILKQRLKKLYNKSLMIKTISAVIENIKSNGIYLYLAWLAFMKRITIGEFTQYFNATGQFSENILGFAGFVTNLNINGKYIESFKDFMELEPVINRSYIRKSNDKLHEILEEARPMELSLENISFRYCGSDRLALKDINYTFQSGRVYVIVGENGAGKTTLMQLFCRLYEPWQGVIKLNGIPIGEFDYLEYKNLFSVVFQDFKYFAFTIGENVALDQYDHRDDVIAKINASLDSAGLREKLEALPNGIDTNLDKIFYEDGIILSGGENQKLAFARALFHKSSILILDEPSSALDPIAEDELLSSFKAISRDKIVIYISHRLSSATLADEVIFMKGGRICEQGAHKTLMEQGGEYAKYYSTQAKYYKM